MSTQVTYKGDEIASFSNDTKTLKTAGKYMEDDISIVDVDSGGGRPEVEPGDVTFIDYDGTALYAYTADQIHARVTSLLSERITPIRYDYEPGWVGNGTWHYENSTNNHSDIYTVQQGRRYLLALGEIVGNAFRSVFVTTNPIGYQNDISGTTISEKQPASAYDSVQFVAESDGYFIITKDHANVTGLESYFYEVIGDPDTVLPENPTHDGLVSQGWNYDIFEITSELAKAESCVVGQMYTTNDGRSRFYIHIPEDVPASQKYVYFRIKANKANDATIHWGDGYPELIAGTSAYNFIHWYATGGDYVISVDPGTSGVVFGGNSTYSIHGSNSGENQKFRTAFVKIEIGNKVELQSYAFQHCYSLETVTLPYGLTKMEQYTFYYDYNLKGVVVPKGVTILYGNSFCKYCYKLKAISIPSTVTTFASNNGSVPSMFDGDYAFRIFSLPSKLVNPGSSMFNNCYSLRAIALHSGVTTIPTSLFNSCYSIESIKIKGNITSVETYGIYHCHRLNELYLPSTLTSIAAQAFRYNYSMDAYHFGSTTPPTLANNNAFSDNSSAFKIYVPYSADHSVLNAYKTATNWSTYASYMVEESIDLINMTPVTITDHGLDYVITKNSFSVNGTAADTFLRTLQDDISCPAGSYEFDFGSVITSSNFMLQLFNVTDDSIIYSFGSWDASSTYTFSLSSAKTLRIRTTIFANAVVDEEHELHLYTRGEATS